jgi:hypothetical protein
MKLAIVFFLVAAAATFLLCFFVFFNSDTQQTRVNETLKFYSLLQVLTVDAMDRTTVVFEDDTIVVEDTVHAKLDSLRTRALRFRATKGVAGIAALHRNGDTVDRNVAIGEWLTGLASASLGVYVHLIQSSYDNIDGGDGFCERVRDALRSGGMVMAGLGSGRLVDSLHAQVDGASLVAVEPNAVVVDAWQQFFGGAALVRDGVVDVRAQRFEEFVDAHADGKRRYSIALLDAFDGDSVPASVTDTQLLTRLAANVLEPDVGVVAMNVYVLKLAWLERIAAAFRGVFAHVYVLRIAGSTTRIIVAHNYSGSSKPLTTHRLRAHVRALIDICHLPSFLGHLFVDSNAPKVHFQSLSSGASK